MTGQPNKPAIEEIPAHLQPYIAEQDPSLYTWIDHASWRYILRISKDFFKSHAHTKYLDGLKETGISTDRIPLISEMDDKLRRFGWRAVAVTGFIPPSAFMEFQSLGVLPIACDMRKIENLAYTPAPDIVHEAAGHAPIIADQTYANYLRAYGEIARKAIISKQDMVIYQAIFDLSETKELPNATDAQIAQTQKTLNRVVTEYTDHSEAYLLSRMNWWTVEYGLIGEKEQKIYGAGLLSSVGESYNCLSDDVKKIPFDLSCVEQAYDITKPQPQLYVARDFAHLTEVLEQFADTMAFRKGGAFGLHKAVEAEYITTATLDSGVQISGTLTEYMESDETGPFYLKYSGPTQLSENDTELSGHDTSYHKAGFGTALGNIILLDKSAAELTSDDLSSLGFKDDQPGTMIFESGVKVTGVLSGGVKNSNERYLILSFAECTVTHIDEMLFDPAWGTYDMACGNIITSVFGGAADRPRYVESTGESFSTSSRSQKCNLTDEQAELNVLYGELREVREGIEDDAGVVSPLDISTLNTIAQKTSQYSDDWLLRMQLLELNFEYKLSADWAARIQTEVEQYQNKSKEFKDLISRGLALLERRNA